MSLLEEAVNPNGGTTAWGCESYYFAEAGEHTWDAVVKEIAKIAQAHGALPSDQVDKLSIETASGVHPWAPLIWGGNCRSRADRFGATGWKPTGPTIYKSLPEMVDFEINALGAQSAHTTF